jgi:hypothetical protein
MLLKYIQPQKQIITGTTVILRTKNKIAWMFYLLTIHNIEILRISGWNSQSLLSYVTNTQSFISSVIIAYLDKRSNEIQFNPWASVLYCYYRLYENLFPKDRFSLASDL